MAKKKYPFGGMINSGTTALAKKLGADDKTAQLIGSGVATATGLIPGMQDNLWQGVDLAQDAARLVFAAGGPIAGEDPTKPLTKEEWWEQNKGQYSHFNDPNTGLPRPSNQSTIDKFYQQYVTNFKPEVPDKPAPAPKPQRTKQEQKAVDKRTKAAEAQHKAGVKQENAETQKKIDAARAALPQEIDMYGNPVEQQKPVPVEDSTPLDNDAFKAAMQTYEENRKLDFEQMKGLDPVKFEQYKQDWEKRNPAPVPDQFRKQIKAYGGKVPPVEKVAPIKPSYIPPSYRRAPALPATPEDKGNKYGTPIVTNMGTGELGNYVQTGNIQRQGAYVHTANGAEFETPINPDAPQITPSSHTIHKASRTIEDPNERAAYMRQAKGMEQFWQRHISTLPEMFAEGGELTEYQEGGTHEANPLGGIPVGNQALVEEGETRWQDYIFSDRIKLPKKSTTFASKSKAIQKKYADRPYDKAAQEALDQEMSKLMQEQEIVRNTKIDKARSAYIKALGGRLQYANGGEPNFGQELRNNRFTADQLLQLEAAQEATYQQGSIQEQALINALNKGEITKDQYVQGLQDIADNEHRRAFGASQNPVTGLEQQGLQNYGMSQGQNVTGFEPTWDPKTGELIDGQQQGAASGSGSSLDENLRWDEYAAAFLPAAATALTAMKPAERERYQRLQAQLIDPTAQLESAKQQGATARATMNQNVRSSALTQGQALSNSIAGNVGMMDSMNRTLGQIQSAADQYNTGVQNNVNAANAQIGMQETIANAQNRARRTDMLLASLGNASQTYLGLSKDQRAYDSNNLYNQEFLRLAQSNEFKYQLGDTDTPAIVYKKK
jgi:hypothetical protein